MRWSTSRASGREVFGWAMFDFANQAYTLLIITVLYGDLYTRVIVGDAADDYRLGNLLWSSALALSYLLVVVTAPVAGAVMDATGSRRRFLFASYLATVACTAGLWFVEPGYVVLGFVLIALSNYTYSMGEAFIAGFLPSLAAPGEMGRVSGLGWSLGYLGGMFATAFTVLVLGEASADNFDSARWVGPFAAAFFLFCALPTFLWVREPAPDPAAGPIAPDGRRPDVRAACGAGVQRVRETLGAVGELRDLAVFLGSLLLAMSGLYVIISFAFIYGAQVIQWDEHVRMLMFVTTQVSAAAGAIGFGVWQDRLGALRTYRVTLFIWLAAIGLIWGTPGLAALARDLLGVEWQAQYVFLVAGCVAGLALGSCQSAGRTMVGIFSPRARAAELFGFWGLSTKLAGAVGLVAVGGFQALFGLQDAILVCGALFAAAFVVALAVNEARGQAVARAAE